MPDQAADYTPAQGDAVVRTRPDGREFPGVIGVDPSNGTAYVRFVGGCAAPIPVEQLRPADV